MSYPVVVCDRMAFLLVVCECVSHLVVSPAGLPHVQGLGVGELSFEAEQDPAVAEEQLQAVLPQPDRKSVV